MLSRRFGFILPVVLVIIGLLALTLASFVFFVNAEVSGIQAHRDAQQARLTAESGLEEVISIIRTAPDDPSVWYDVPDRFRHALVWAETYTREEDPVRRMGNRLEILAMPAPPVAWRYSVVAPNLDGPPDTFRYGITPEAGKLNLNSASDAEIERLLTPLLQELRVENAAELVAALLDWRDEDDDVRPGGAENEYYTNLVPAYTTKNGPLDTLEEVLQVKGWSAALLYGEDTNRNGLLDANEDDGDASFPLYDNGDGILNHGIAPFVTVWSREPGSSPSGATGPEGPGQEQGTGEEQEPEQTPSPAEGEGAGQPQEPQPEAPAQPGASGTGVTPSGAGASPGGAGASPAGKPGAAPGRVPGVSPATPGRAPANPPGRAPANPPGRAPANPGGRAPASPNPQPGKDQKPRSAVAGKIETRQSGKNSADKPPDKPGQSPSVPGSGQGRPSGAGLGQLPGAGQGQPQGADLGQGLGAGQGQPQGLGQGQPTGTSQPTTPGAGQPQGAGTPQGGMPVGLVNVNTAPLRVLQALDGMPPGAAEAIVAMRQEMGSEALQSPDWLMTSGAVDAATYDQIKDRITTRALQFHIEIVAYGDHTKLARRYEWIIEMRGTVAQVLYHRDLTGLGLAWPIDDETFVVKGR